MKDFIAIDFETANECASSVCSIGAVLVRDGEIVKTFYSLIRPEPDYYKWFCQNVHGLSHEDTDGAEVFPFVWKRLEEELLEGADALVSWIKEKAATQFLGYILTFAWNEFEEGGIICPVMNEQCETDISRLKAFRKVSDYSKHNLKTL